MAPLPRQREELFAQHCAHGLTDRLAFEKAGYKPNDGNAYRLRSKPRIRDRIAEIQNSFDTNFVATKQYVIDKLAKNVRIALAEMPVKTGVVGAEVEELIYQPGAANFALSKIGLELGMFNEKREVHLKTDLSDLTDAQLLRRYQQEAQRLLERGGDIIDAEVVEDEGGK